MMTTTIDVTLDGATLQVTRTGERGGTVIVAAHPADAFGATATELMHELAGADVIGVNPRGVGASAPGVQSVDEMADDLERTRQQLGVGRVVFWGMSGGGWIGLAWARRHPGALRGLLLESVCACFRERLQDPECLLSPNHPAWQGKLHASSGGGGWADVAGVGSVLRDAGGEPIVVAPFPLEPRMKTIMRRLLELDVRPWLHELRIPALVIAGADDVVAPLRHVRALADGLRAELLEVAGAGHVPSASKRDDVTAAIRMFLSRTREP